eukprot:TRINITY_DN93582_c0_g1_i1.p1 TRINITY_DN93582_c0_g1~~TRINITY_DN93582_c0_g1_i1.p1  ORF type:complete len:339 (-),score=74.66 TRINITY_DN93582_c0_g1_i1:94-1032(-)
MGVSGSSTLAIMPAQSLLSLGLTGESTVEEAVRALQQRRDELLVVESLSSAGGTEASAGDDPTAEGAGLRPRRQAAAAAGLLSEAGSSSSSSSKPPWAQQRMPSTEKLGLLAACGDGAEDMPAGAFSLLGNAAACNTRQVKLKELCPELAEEVGGDASKPTELLLQLAEISSPGHRRRWAMCRCRRPRGVGNRRNRRACRRRVGAALWKRLPAKWQAKLEPQLKTFMFYAMCAKWALRWLWEDRHVLLKDFGLSVADDFWGQEAQPPLSGEKIMSELRPFAYAGCVGAAYCFYDITRRLLQQSSAPIDLPLD